MLIVLLEYINLFQSERQHETNIWEGLSCPLPFYIAVFQFQHSYCNYYHIAKNFSSKKVWQIRIIGNLAEKNFDKLKLENVMEIVKIGEKLGKLL